MALSGAERARRCREKKKAEGLAESVKRKDRERKRLARSMMTSTQLNALRLRQQINLGKFRAKPKANPTVPSASLSLFASKQSKAKALKRVLKVLPVNKDKKVELVQTIAEQFNLVKSNQKFERNQRSLPSHIKKKVYDYYFRDDITYQAPGKRDNITIKENGLQKALQKRYLLYTLRELHKLFIQENPTITISRSSFQDLRPVNAFVKLLVCDDTQQTCMFSDCNQCSFNLRNKIEHKIIDPAHVIKWSLWTTSDEGRAVKCDYEGSVQNCVRVLQTKIKQFLFHAFIKRKQSNYFEMLRDNSSDERCLLQVDYSENFALVEQNEIQSDH